MVNWIVVLVASVIAYIVGALWYSPVLFGNLWLKLNKVNNVKAHKMSSATIVSGFILTVIFNIVLAYVVQFSEVVGFFGGMSVGFLLWVGFIATTSFSSVLYLKKPLKLYWIDSLHYLVTMMLVAGILAVW